MRDVIVVGGGIIGATVAKAMSEQAGADVLLLDDGRANAGTPPSGGHLNPAWFGQMKREQYEPALALLDEVWGLISEDFRVMQTGRSTVIHRVDTDLVVSYPRLRGTVVGLRHLGNYPMVKWVTNDSVGHVESVEERCRLLLVATGCWVYELIQEVQTKARQGVSFRLSAIIPSPLIDTWAPYKQIVAHQHSSKEVWVGDGSAVYPENWGGRTKVCLERCLNTLELDQDTRPTRTLIGWRPYCSPAEPGDPCLLQRLGPRAWVATGAGKMGTIAAGWVAKRLLREL